MSSHLFSFSADTTKYVVALFSAALVGFTVLSRPSKLDCIPTVGSNSWLGSWWASLKYLTNAPGIVKEGYEKHKSAPFKMATLSRWLVILSSPEHMEELQRAPSDTLSFTRAIEELLQLDFTAGPAFRQNPYHIPLVRTHLTRNLGTLYPEIRNEVITAFDDVLNLRGNEWKSVEALSSMQLIICRTYNRVLVGLPLCRDPEWIDLNIRFTLLLFKGASIIGLFPRFLRPIVTRLSTRIHQSNQQARKLLSPIIKERRELDEHANKWADKPNDFLTWLMEEAEGKELTEESLTTRMVGLNVTGFHSSSSNFTHALFYLAANPQYIQPLREEVEAIVEKDGWSKTSLAKMHKVDSFLRECLRIDGMFSLGVSRMAMKDFTFSDGTFIPKGTIIGIPSRCIHHDEKYYKDAAVFKPFRFAEINRDGREGGRDQFVTTTSDYLTFGIGDQACPGRFFVSTMMKTMLAHIVTTYDIKLEDGATAQRHLSFHTLIIPNPDAKVLFRKRVE